MASHGSAPQDGLDELVLPQWLGEVVVHLCGQTLLAIANHGVRRQRNNGRRRDGVVAFPLTDLCSSLESTLYDFVSKRKQFSFNSVTYHDRHLHVHEHAVVTFLLDVLKGLKTVVRYCDAVVVLF